MYIYSFSSHLFFCSINRTCCFTGETQSQQNNSFYSKYLCVCTCVRFVGEKHEWKPKNRPIILQFICILLTYRVIFAQGHSLLYSGFLDGVEKSCTCCTN